MQRENLEIYERFQNLNSQQNRCDRGKNASTMLTIQQLLK